MAAMSDRDPEVLEETIRLLRYESETWRMLIAKLASESGTDDVASGAGPRGGSVESKNPPSAGDGAIGERLHLAG